MTKTPPVDTKGVILLLFAFPVPFRFDPFRISSLVAFTNICNKLLQLIFFFFFY